MRVDELPILNKQMSYDAKLSFFIAKKSSEIADKYLADLLSELSSASALAGDKKIKRMSGIKQKYSHYTSKQSRVDPYDVSHASSLDEGAYWLMHKAIEVEINSIVDSI